MIRVENLTKRYGDRLAVDGISFEVPRGEVVGILGPNGAGKSTTLRMLTGFMVPTEGSVRIGDIDAIGDPVAARKLIGYLPESVPLHRELRVEEYLRFRARLKGVARKQLRARVEAALEQARIEDVRRRIIGQLSKGYRSRVGLADALVADPPLLVLDEPTAGLDPNQIRQVRDLIRGLAGEKTVLLSTHILPEVESTCGRVLIFHRGRLVGEGKPGQLRTGDAGGLPLVLEGRGERARFEAVLRDVPGVRRIEQVTVLSAEPPLLQVRLTVETGDVAEAVFLAVAGAGLSLRQLRTEGDSLEDVFAKLTTHDQAALGPGGLEEDAEPAAGKGAA